MRSDLENKRYCTHLHASLPEHDQHDHGALLEQDHGAMPKYDHIEMPEHDHGAVAEKDY
jgi:hypothetical protein